MRKIWLAGGILALAVTPIAGFAQAGVTPLLMGPSALGPRHSELGGYITIENSTDIFGIYRKGIHGGLDFGARAGHSDAFGGGFSFGGDFRYELRKADRDFPLNAALAGGLQVTLADAGDYIAFPIGVSLGRKVGSRARPIMLYGLPQLRVERFSREGAAPGTANTEIRVSLEFGGQMQIGRRSFLDLALTTGNDVSLAAGLRWK